MSTLTPSYANHIKKQIQQFIKHDLPHIVGTEYVRQAQQAFLDEGHTDKKLTKWEKRKKDTGLPILTGKTKELRTATHYEARPGRVTIVNDKPYAGIHNFGGRAGQGGAAKIPARPFVAPSEKADERIEELVTNYLKKHLMP